ncbi:hypothetical protein LMG28138_01806 [Pararobbsia alpina]|uniref:Uncharacterized protein n=1 Tax=Pararobbsia alpina TaxID=621374 RepID=A0A6S7B1A1_9BURK|nr:hypothetical protein LMG28138_01806 [Pararobbsia alpina]
MKPFNRAYFDESGCVWLPPPPKMMSVTIGKYWPLRRTFEIQKPRIYYSIEGLVPSWVCTNGSGYPGFGGTPRQAWNDWASRTLT